MSLRCLFQKLAWLAFLPLSGMFWSCTSAETVKEKSLDYLENRYRESFQVVSIDMQRNEGNWGTARLEVIPEKSPELEFRLNYNYSDGRVSFENYLLRIWEQEVRKRLQGEFPELAEESWQLRLARKNSLASNTMDLPVNRELSGIDSLGEPTLGLERYRVSGEPQPDFARLAKLIQRIRALGLKKVTLRLEYGEAGKNGKLLAQSYGSHFGPSASELRRLFWKPGDSYLSSDTKNDYQKALQLKEQGNSLAALSIFESIVRNHDSPYRYNPYVVAQSGHVYESAFEAGVIYMELGRKDRARKYFDLLEDRLSYEEAPLQYARYLRQIQEWKRTGVLPEMRQY